MNRPAVATLLAFLLGTGSCALLTGPDRSEELTAARRRWLTTGPVDYQFLLQRSCECLLGGRRILVTVLSGRVTGARDQDTGQDLAAAELQGLPAIPAVFDQIELAIAQRAVLLEADYDEQDGHPTRVRVDVSSTVADDEYTLLISNLQEYPWVSPSP